MSLTRTLSSTKRSALLSRGIAFGAKPVHDTRLYIVDMGVGILEMLRESMLMETHYGGLTTPAEMFKFVLLGL